MKTATFTSLRVEPEPLEAAASALREGELLTSLIETAMRETRPYTGGASTTHFLRAVCVRARSSNAPSSFK